jgi:hypothetical protein
MRQKYFSKTAFTWFSVIVIISAVLLTFIDAGRSSSQTTADGCIGLSMKVSTPTGSGDSVNTTALSGEADINITTPSTPQISQIIISANDKQIGQAQPSGTNNWIFKWATTLWPTVSSRSVILTAKANYADGHTCPVLSTMNPYYMTTQQTSTLNLVASPPSWDSNVNSSQLISVTSSLLPTSSTLSSLNINPYAIYEWSPSSYIGQIFSPTNTFLDNTQRNYTSGTTAGNNLITVTATYGGAVSTAIIPITVKALDTTTTAPATSSNQTITVTTDTTKTTTPDTNAATATTAATTATTATQVTSSQVQVGTVTKSCVETEITTERYSTINSGTSRPTADELTKISNCFATSKYVLPSSFSPVDPMKIDTLTVENAVATVSKLENVTKTVDSVKKDTLKISGKAKPKTTVLIYVYSDPLIITTTSDSDGNWQYTLEDPLEPGKHEVYAVVNKGDGTYKRSDPLSFLISTASATAVNPNGLSLKLGETPTATASQSNSNLIYYIIGSGCALAVALVSLFIAIRIHLKHRPKPMPVNDVSSFNETPLPDNANIVETVNAQSPGVGEAFPVTPNTPSAGLGDQTVDNPTGPTITEEYPETKQYE